MMHTDVAIPTAMATVNKSTPELIPAERCHMKAAQEQAQRVPMPVFGAQCVHGFNIKSSNSQETAKIVPPTARTGSAIVGSFIERGDACRVVKGALHGSREVHGPLHSVHRRDCQQTRRIVIKNARGDCRTTCATSLPYNVAEDLMHGMERWLSEEGESVSDSAGKLTDLIVNVAIGVGCLLFIATVGGGIWYCCFRRSPTASVSAANGRLDDGKTRQRGP